MRPSLSPFNLNMLQLNQNNIKFLKEVKVLDIMEPSKTKFHPEGLWSNEIFGSVGEDRRYTSFAYINLKMPVIHPLLFKQLTSAKSLYKEIMAGETYAIWSEQEGDFIRSNPIDGKTGYHFFISHYLKLNIKDTNTTRRDQLIRLYNKFKEKSLNQYVVVIPAALRDVEFENGRMVVDDTNSFYRKLLSLANNITEAGIRSHPELMDVTRYSIQKTFVELFDHLLSMVEGKHKLFLGKMASRKIFNGTRNVITSVAAGGRYLGDRAVLRHNNTMVGLFQMMKSILPIARKHIKDGYLSQVFLDPNEPVRLVNKKTLQSEEVNLDPAYFDRYQSDEGIEKLIQMFSHDSLRHRALEIEDHYLGLIYKGPDSTFKIIRDIREVPANRSKEDVEPLTFVQLMYLSLFTILNNKYPNVITRYPITGVGSIPSTLPFTKTTVNDEIRYELDENWNKTDRIASCFPINGETFIASMGPPQSVLGLQGGDYDGDTESLNTVYSDEAIEEQQRYLNSFKSVIGNDGRIKRSMGFDTVNFVCHNLSGD